MLASFDMTAKKMRKPTKHDVRTTADSQPDPELDDSSSEAFTTDTEEDCPSCDDFPGGDDVVATAKGKNGKRKSTMEEIKPEPRKNGFDVVLKKKPGRPQMKLGMVTCWGTNLQASAVVCNRDGHKCRVPMASKSLPDGVGPTKT